MNLFIDTWEKLYQFWIDGWQWIFEQLMTGAAVAIEAIPVPGFLTTLGMLTLPDGISWFASVFELPTGAAIVVSAWTIRFLIRRLPFIG